MSIHEQVRDYLNQVRRRLRLQTVARGLGICGLTALLATILAVLGANAWKFSDTAVGVASAFLWIALVGTVAWFLAKPLLRKISDARIARFVEEQHPEFRDRLVTAVDLSDKSVADPSARLFGQLVAEDALRRTPQATPGQLIEPRRIFRPLIWAAGSLAMILLLGLFGPGIFRYGTKVLWVGWAQAKANPLYQIQVTPGDIVIGRSTDQEIVAQPVGFLPQEMRLHVLYSKGANWESAGMLSGERGGNFRFLLMNVQEPLQYYVESNGIRSSQYKIDVIAVPRVERMEVRYHYPAYSGLADSVDERGGDIIALKGTEVTLTLHTDAPSPGGKLMLDKGDAIPLQTLNDQQLQATWTLSQDSLYHVVLQDHRKREARASAEYLMQAVADMAPSVRLTRPGRDLQPTPIEEVVIGFEGQDDVRLADLSLHYSVNGSSDKAVPLVRNGAAQIASGTDLLALENFSLVPGDLITYYGVAKDAASNSTSTDMFFLQVRPFERSYTQAQAGGGGGGGQGQEDTFLSERQKEVISATWNVLRSKDKQQSGQLAEAAQVLSTVQRSLAEQAKTLAGRLDRRELTGVNDEFAGLAENLGKAVEAMGPAADSLEKEKFQDAIGSEQTALQYLLRAEATYRDIQVAFGNQGGGGGGGGSAGRDLTDLFSLELDTSKNQYETLSQFSAGQNNAEMQDVMRKLQELARRQEELARQDRQNPQDSMRAANRWEQEMLRRETEDLSRRLEQLSRQMNSSQLGQASRSLSQAARDMQQAGQQGGQQAGQSSQQSGSQSASSGSSGSSEQARALERLREANQMLSGQQSQWDEQKLQELGREADELAGLQQGVVDQTESLGQQGQQQNQGQDPNGSGRNRGQRATALTPQMRQAMEQMMSDKVDLLDGLRALEQQINQSAARMAGSEPETAKDLRGASSWIQDERMADKIRQGAWLSQQGLFPTAGPVEEDLLAGLQQLRNRLQNAQRSLAAGGGAEDKLQQALRTAERVRQGLESLGQPGDQQGQQGPGGQSGQQQAQGSQQGQQGQQEQQAAGGQQGNGGQQGGNASGQPQSGNQLSSGWGGSRADGIRNGFAGTSGTTNGGAWNPGGYWPLGPLTPEQQAELEHRTAELRQEAGQLRGLVPPDSEFGKTVQELVRSMQALDWERFQGNLEQMERLRAELTEQWKELELRLRRELDLEGPDTVRLATQERVPEQYRAIVEEYYRSLSRTRR